MPDIHDLVRTDYKAVDKRDELHSVMGWVWGDSDKLPIVTDQGKPYGIVNDRALITRRLDHHAKLHQYVLATRALTPDTELVEALRRMGEFRAAYMPVEENGKLKGFVSSIDLVRELGADRTAGELCVPVTMLREGMTFGDALHAFNQEYVDYLPVFDAQGRLQWVLPRRKVLQMEHQSGANGRKNAGGIKVSWLNDPIDTFCDDAQSLRHDAPLEVVLKHLEDWGYACVTAKDGRLEGIVTPETLCRAVAT